MDGKEEVVVCGSAHGVRECKECKGKWMSVSEMYGDVKLKCHDAEYDVLGEGFVTHQLCDLWIGFHNSHSTGTMWFLCHEPEKVCRVEG